jgi:hypothetical protein
VVNFDEANPNVQCYLPNLPRGLAGPTGQYFQGKLVVCGGNPGGNYICSCYALQNGTWVTFPSKIQGIFIFKFGSQWPMLLDYLTSNYTVILNDCI